MYLTTVSGRAPRCAVPASLPGEETSQSAFHFTWKTVNPAARTSSANAGSSLAWLVHHFSPLPPVKKITSPRGLAEVYGAYANSPLMLLVTPGAETANPLPLYPAGMSVGVV